MKQQTKRQNRPGVVIYLRVSSDGQQNPANSFDYQRQRIDDVLARSGTQLRVLKVYQDILSGRNNQRPDYQKMLSDARDGLFSHIAVYSVDRLGRSSDETLTVVREMMKLGIEIVVADSPNMELTTPSGSLFLGIRAVIAQFEVEMLGQRVRDTKRSILRSGGWPSPVPDGYERHWE